MTGAERRFRRVVLCQDVSPEGWLCTLDAGHEGEHGCTDYERGRPCGVCVWSRDDAS